MTHSTINTVTKRIAERSKPTREAYVARMQKQAEKGPRRLGLSCGNLAHGFAACGAEEKKVLSGGQRANIGIVSAYNEMLSAHKPYEHFPAIIKDEAMKAGGIAQFAGGTPAMCDGVTQGQPGMDLSLFSRDVIAMSTGIALTHNMFDTAMLLGICDKIVPGLLIGALSFGHLPAIFVPGGPMPSGLPNKEKARIRQLFAEGKVGRDELLEAESKSYHSEGTCTFYGTANSNQMMMEMMGLQLPGSSFVNPHTPLRDALTRAATRRAIEMSALNGDSYTPLYEIVDERAIVNAIVGLMATGGSTNHTIHLIAMAKAAGIQINWTDFHDISEATPLLCRIYPNGEADVNHFHAAGGMGFVIRELLEAGLLHGDIRTVSGGDLSSYTQEPFLDNDDVSWKEGATKSGNEDILTPVSEPVNHHGGMALLEGNLGRAVIKTSAVAEEHQVIEAPAKVFRDQNDLMKAFKAGELSGDFVAVITHEGPAACGMPELHKLTPPLGVLQDMGFKVALVTDGRMSGASGKVPAAIHVTPEAVKGGAIAKVQDGDVIRLDANAGVLEVKVSEAELAKREAASPDISNKHSGHGRDLFANARACVTGAEEGASFLGLE